MQHSKVAAEFEIIYIQIDKVLTAVLKHKLVYTAVHKQGNYRIRWSQRGIPPQRCKHTHSSTIT